MSVFIPIQNTNKFTRVDDAVAETLRDSHLYLNGSGYVQFNTKRGTVMLHRFVLNYKGKASVHHRNADKLDNTAENLQILSMSDNAAAKTIKPPKHGYSNVQRIRRLFYGKFRLPSGKLISTKGFDTPFKAAVEVQNWFDIHRPHLNKNIIW